MSKSACALSKLQLLVAVHLVHNPCAWPFVLMPLMRRVLHFQAEQQARLDAQLELHKAKKKQATVESQLQAQRWDGLLDLHAEGVMQRCGLLALPVGIRTCVCGLGPTAFGSAPTEGLTWIGSAAAAAAIVQDPNSEPGA
jgi:hypothetical protein